MFLDSDAKVTLGMTLESTGYPGKRESTYEAKPPLSNTISALKETNPKELKK
jgi:hypothetical protein